MKVKYELIHQDKTTGARFGRAIFTAPDSTTKSYETPMFMPVGTQATVKTLSPEQVKTTNAGIILSNTYHLWLRPTTKSSVLLTIRKKTSPKRVFILNLKLMAKNSF